MRVGIVQKKQFLNIFFTGIYVFIAFTVFAPFIDYIEKVIFGYEPHICPDLAFCIPSQTEVIVIFLHLVFLFILYLILLKIFNKNINLSKNDHK